MVEEVLEKQAGKAATLAATTGLCSAAVAAGQGAAAPLEACRLATLSRRLFVELLPLLEVCLKNVFGGLGTGGGSLVLFELAPEGQADSRIMTVCMQRRLAA